MKKKKNRTYTDEVKVLKIRHQKKREMIQGGWFYRFEAIDRIWVIGHSKNKLMTGRKGEQRPLEIGDIIRISYKYLDKGTFTRSSEESEYKQDYIAINKITVHTIIPLRDFTKKLRERVFTEKRQASLFDNMI